jgi:hypothetical protein
MAELFQERGNTLDCPAGSEMYRSDIFWRSLGIRGREKYIVVRILARGIHA